MRRRRLTRDEGLTVLLTAVVALSVANAVTVDVLWLRAVSALTLVGATFVLAHHLELTGMRRFVGRMPRQVTVELNDDGTATALVVQQSGELLTIHIPEDVVDEGRDAVSGWVVGQALEAGR